MLEIDDIIDEEFGSSDPEHQYLFFVCQQEMYAIKSLQVQEIVEYSEITKVPMVNSFVTGVMNIRGNIVPVIDLTERFGLGKIEIEERTSVIVINYHLDEETTSIGILVDEVYEVDNIDESNLVERPVFGSRIDPVYIGKMGKYQNRYLPILNIETLLDINDLAAIVE